jgi:nucleoside-diphosphate-sugar epimerase
MCSAPMQIEGVALRYGFFYGPKTWYYPGEAAANMVMQQQNAVVGKGEGVSSFVHIHDAAIATVALLAASRECTTWWMMTLRRRPCGCRRLLSLWVLRCPRT